MQDELKDIIQERNKLKQDVIDLRHHLKMSREREVSHIEVIAELRAQLNEYNKIISVRDEIEKSLNLEVEQLRAKLERAEAKINEIEQSCDILSGVIKEGSDLSSDGKYYATAHLLKNTASNLSTQCGVGWMSPEKVKDLENKIMSLKIAMGLMLRVTDRTEGVQPEEPKDWHNPRIED